MMSIVTVHRRSDHHGWALLGAQQQQQQPEEGSGVSQLWVVFGVSIQVHAESYDSISTLIYKWQVVSFCALRWTTQC